MPKRGALDSCPRHSQRLLAKPTGKILLWAGAAVPALKNYCIA
jgi:hypothetical protein